MPPRSGHRTAALCILFLGTLVLIPGCSPSQDERQDARQEEVTGAEWEWIQANKQTLDERRERLAQLEAAASAQPAASAQGAQTPQTPQNTQKAQDAARLRQERQAVDELAREFHRRLVEYINASAAATPGEPLGERQLAALRLKSDEDILLAREHIQRNGDYRRAIEVYESALAADPDNSRLKEELETAKARRYITRERFAQVKEGMTQEEVRRLLGQPNLQDIRPYPERNVVAWFYPKDASGAAAAVWFKSGDAGEVYQLDFEAIQPPQAGQPRRPAGAAPAAPRPTPPPAGSGTP